MAEIPVCAWELRTNFHCGLEPNGFGGLMLLTLYSMLCNYGQIHRHRVLLDWKVQGRYPRRGILAGVMRGNN